ncbi:RHS repeat-associated core domain-containing protein [Salmonella enterica subsp. enterica]|nr:RHS repeat-associated core domain-containing protein [Salmonella enterica subsp. enterica]
MYQPVGMQGQHYDEESGLCYNRYRYYDPETGRYITQDPIGLKGGESILISAESCHDDRSIRTGFISC